MSKVAEAKTTNKTLTREGILALLSNCYEDARIFIYRAILPNANFEEGMSLFESQFVSRDEAIEILRNAKKVCRSPRCAEDYVIDKTRMIDLHTVYNNQIFNTPGTEGYTKICGRSPHFHVFFRVDHENQKLAFKLGDKEVLLDLVCNPEWVFRLVGKKLYVQSSKKIEEFLKDSFWCDWAVKLGRSALGVEV